MVDEVGDKLLLVLSDEPLVNADEVVFVHLPSYYLLLEDRSPSQLLAVSEEVPETMEFDNNVL